MQLFIISLIRLVILRHPKWLATWERLKMMICIEIQIGVKVCSSSRLTVTANPTTHVQVVKCTVHFKGRWTIRLRLKLFAMSRDIGLPFSQAKQSNSLTHYDNLLARYQRDDWLTLRFRVFVRRNVPLLLNGNGFAHICTKSGWRGSRKGTTHNEGRVSSNATSSHAASLRHILNGV